MKTMFDPDARAELAQRIQALNKGDRARWGKMDVYQMIRHCNQWDEWVLGKGRYASHVYKQSLPGKLFGKWALKVNTKDARPIGKNMPAGKFAIKDKVTVDLHTEKERWRRHIADYVHFSNDCFVHEFFGKMTREQIGIFAYKHADHHLRQFGV
ncbi:DUF1569 domain-containing protein [Taibaiella koreensis]|uniref:DUF1569 domain-containing protein n=1 Tax=Taibaiella koreensis TaxID=1268548 RepID=UPI000E59DBA8|nr:DUF1569 domain-containing protein [Taibaiella koreensis]